MKRMIIAAEAQEDNRLKDIIDKLEDDFDYIISGFEKLDRDGVAARESGIAVANQLVEQLNSITSQIAEIVGGEE